MLAIMSARVVVAIGWFSCLLTIGSGTSFSGSVLVEDGSNSGVAWLILQKSVSRLDRWARQNMSRSPR